jgi:hypothetical protein
MRTGWTTLRDVYTSAQGITSLRQLVWPPLQLAMPALVSHIHLGSVITGLNRNMQRWKDGSMAWGWDRGGLTYILKTLKVSNNPLLTSILVLWPQIWTVLVINATLSKAGDRCSRSNRQLFYATILSTVSSLPCCPRSHRSAMHKSNDSLENRSWRTQGSN